VTALTKRLSVAMLAFMGEEQIQQVLSVAGDATEQFAISVITDTGESVVECLARYPVLQISVGMLPSVWPIGGNSIRFDSRPNCHCTGKGTYYRRNERLACM